MISFSKISAAILGVCLVSGLFYYYKTYSTTQKKLDSMISYPVSDQKFLIHSKYGFPILSFSRSIDEKEYSSLSFILKKLLPSESSVLHLGAHTGLHTILVSKYLKGKGKIVAFEGHPKLFSLLKENRALHNLESTLQIFPLIPALEPKTLSICLDASPPLSSDTTVNSAYEKNLEGENCYDIELKPLDSLLLSPVDFILIENDVNVPDVLGGGYKLLADSNWPPILIVPSISLSHTNHKRWIDRLKKEGYYFYKLIPTSHTAFEVVKIDPYHAPSNGGEYLFFSRELLPVLIDQ